MRLAELSKAELRCGAAVGGATPMLERCQQHRGEIDSLQAVLNGTCNFVLDTCTLGVTLKEALAQVQRLGFAETDPSQDLSGRDAARKLQLLARAAFGVELPLIIHSLDDAVVGSARAVTAFGERLRQVARAALDNGRVVASVAFERVRPDSPFYDLKSEWNALTLTLTTREAIETRGRGAGRWPTTEAVIADIFDVIRSR